MISVSLAQLASILGATLHGISESEAAQQPVCHVQTNSRELQAGDLFVALVGARFDAHQFLEQALAAGAGAALVSRPQAIALPQLVVADTTLALGQLGAWVKQQLHPFTVALTGSVGKTSVKEMTAAIFQQAAPTLATKGNLNNTIGAPLTLLELTPAHQYAVIELGANAPGEIRYTANLVQPDAALINNVQPAHLEGFGSLEGVAAAKSEIFEALGENGTAIINLDDDYADFMLNACAQHQKVCFSSQVPADLWASQLQANAAGCYRFLLNVGTEQVAVQLPLPGRHQVNNALAAASLAYCAKLPLATIVRGLAQAPIVPGRTEVHRLTERLMVIDDSYNANLASTKAGIDTLAHYPGKTALLFGDMGELGHRTEADHAAVGEYARQKGIDRLYTVGTVSALATQAFGTDCHFADQQSLQQQLFTWLESESEPVTILIKGSRSARMEHYVAALRQQFEASRSC